MTQKCGGRILTDEEVHANVIKALTLEEKKELRRLGKDFEDRRIDTIDNVCGEDGKVEKFMDDIVLMNKTSSTNSLSRTEWMSMEAAMTAEERQTHRNLQAFFTSRAKDKGIAAEKEDDDDDDDPEMLELLEGELPEGAEGEGGGGGDSDEEDAKAAARKKQEEEDQEEVGAIDKAKNWSSVNVIAQESKLAFRGSFTAIAFTNWIWWRCFRPRLEETKSSLPELSEEEMQNFCIDDVEEILGEFMPAVKVKEDKKDKKEDKKDKKDDKKDKKDKDDKKSKKDDKEDKKANTTEPKAKADKKKKKDAVKLNTQEKLQVKNLIANMVYGESGKNKTIVTGWVNLIDEKDVARTTPWEVQLAHVMRMLLMLEYSAKKKKEAPNLMSYYEMSQSIADAISFMKKHYALVFDKAKQDEFLPLSDALNLQKRFQDGSVFGTKFELLWYLQNGAHLLAGSNFAKKHRTTVFKPFNIQEQIVDAITQPGPQLVFGIAPPGTGKTAVVSHILNLFPAHSLVFCCPALPVVLSIGRICNSLGHPYAFVKGRRITPSYSCGRGLATHADQPDKGQTAVDSLRYLVCKLNLERKKKRLAEKKRKRNLHDLKRFPRMFLMCDSGSAAWLLRQLDPNRTILVVDEPPMGSDQFPENAEDNPLSCAMMQTMMTPMYKTLLMSATLPRPEALPCLVDSFMNRFRLDAAKKDNHVRECCSTELDRGAVMCGPNGGVAFPHQSCAGAEELKKLCARLPTDPLVLKAYTERALAVLLQRWETMEKDGKMRDGFLKRMVRPQVKFGDLSELNHASIRSYAMELLRTVSEEGDDEFCKAFCDSGEDTANLFPAFNLTEMMFSNAWAFPGLTLVSGDQPMEIMMDMSQRLREQFPKLSDLEADIKKQEEAAKKAEKFADDDEKAMADGTQTKLKFSPELVIQSEAFIKRWCPSRPESAHQITRILPTVAEFLAIKDLPVDERWQMLALSGVGAYDPKLDADVNNPVYTQWVLDAMTNNKLACVTAGKEFTWGANVPASTVVVTKSFAETTSVAGMLQYVGRAARRGLTTHGQAIFERQEDLDRIFASPDGLSTEALTMERYAKWWLSRSKEW